MLTALLICLGFFVLDAIWIRLLSLLNVSFGSFASTLFIFTFLRVIIFIFLILIFTLLAKTRFKLQRNRFLFILNLALLLFAIYGFFIEPFRLTINTIQVPVPGLQQPVRIIQLSDIHVERTTTREKKLPGAVAALNPDMIVITGDFVNESYGDMPATIQSLVDLCRQFQATMGVYAVNGNVETVRELKRWLAGLPIKVLDNEIVRIPEIGENFVLIGLSFQEWTMDGNRLTRLMQTTQPEDFTLLLYHKPDLAYMADDAGVDLFLAGHTHGGQIRLPFYGAIFTNSIFGKAFEMGLYMLDHTTMYVNRGLGFTGGTAPRIRFLAPPEITIIDLVPEE